MSQYDKLDALILDRIGRMNGATLLELHTSEPIYTEVERLADATGRLDWRIVAPRLRVLRRRGLIRFSRPAWRLSERVRKEA